MSVDLARDTIFVALAGSHAHGTADASSDVDLRGVCIAPLELRVALFRQFEQFEGALEGTLWETVRARLERHPTAAASLGVKVESVLFDVAKFVRLCASANPNALEVLFADERDWVYERPPWRILHRERQRFLTRRLQQTYLGYAMAQLKKIRAHRAWLLHPPTHQPSRDEFGLPRAGTLGREERDRIEQSIAERVRGYGLDALELPKPQRIALNERLRAFWCDALAANGEDLEERLRSTAIAGLNLPLGLVQTLEAERRYRTALRHWEAYEAWKLQRNPRRAELERRYGYDTKHAMHLLRLMRTGLELLEHGELRVRRADADELRAVRDGKLSFDELLAHADELQERMEAAARRSTLPEELDFEFVEELSLELIRTSLP